MPNREGAILYATPAAPRPARRTTAPGPADAGVGMDPLRLAVYGLMLISIGRIHQYLSFLVPLRPALLLIGVGVAYLVLNPHHLRASRAFGTAPGRLVLALFAFACISAPFGLSLGGSATYIAEAYHKVIIFWVLLMATLTHARDIRRAVLAYLLAVGVLMFFSLFVFETGQQDLVVRLTGDDMYMYDANDLSLLLNAALPLALLAIHTGGKGTKLLGAAYVAGLMTTLALAGSRGGFIGLLAMGASLFFLLKGIALAKRVVAVAALALALAVAAPPGYWDQMRTIADRENNYNYDSTHGRMEIWKRGMGYMMARPIFGVGIDNFGRAEGTISTLARNYRPGDQLLFAAPHSTFVEAGAELGIPGLLILLGLIGSGTVGLLRLRQRLPREWAAGSMEQQFLLAATAYLPAAWIGFAATGAFVTFLYLPPLYILAALSAGVYARAGKLLVQTNTRGPRRGR